MAGAPVPDSVMPTNTLERGFLYCMMICGLCAVAFSVANITATLVELRKTHSEEVETRRELRKYLQKNKIPTNLASRILAFAITALKRKRALSLAPSILNLISKSLLLELTVTQRSALLRTNGLFDILSVTSREIKVFSAICSAMQLQEHEENEVVFEAKVQARGMYATSHGSFQLIEPGWEDEEEFAIPVKINTWLCEVSVFMRYTPRKTLTTTTFSETLLVGMGGLIVLKKLLTRTLIRKILCLVMNFDTF